MFTPLAVASQANTKKHGSPGPGHVSGVEQSRGREGIINITIIISDSFGIMLFTFGLVSFRQSPVPVAGLNSAASLSGPDLPDSRLCPAPSLGTTSTGTATTTVQQQWARAAVAQCWVLAAVAARAALKLPVAVVVEEA